MKVATYTRISTDESRQPFSLEAQSERLKAYISSQDGWKLFRAYTDQMSGKTLDRPGLQQALDDAKLGRFELLLVYKVDRLGRSMSGLVKVLEELQQVGVGFRSASEPFDTSTAAGRMMVQLLGVFAEFEREMIVERTKMGLAKKAAKGEWTGGAPPFGYRYEAERQLLVPLDDEAVIVKAIFDRYLHDGEGSMSIAKWLNDRAEFTKRGSRWTPDNVIAILRNPTYVGQLPFNGELYEASHEPLIQADVFERANELLENRSDSWKLRRSNPSDYLLTGLLRCRECGHGFIGTVGYGKGGGAYRYYVCYSRRRHGKKSCDQDLIPAERIEDRILAATIAELDDGSIFHEAAERARQSWEENRSSGAQEIQRLKRKIASRHQSVDRYLKAFEAGRLPEDMCSYRVREVGKEISTLEEELAVLENSEDEPSFQDHSLFDLKSQIEAAINVGQPQKVKKMLSGIVASVVVHSRRYAEPSYFSPGVRVVSGQRRRTGIEPASELSPAHWF